MIETPTAAARRAGDVLLSYWRNLPESSIEQKALNDFVSRADRESETAIVDSLLASSPTDSILGEEGSRRSGSSGREWIIDPLDGTSNFIAGFPFWCVSIGVRERGRLVGGVIFDPLRDELFRAERGSGAVRNSQRLSVGRRESAEGGVLATGLPVLAQE